MTQVFVVVLVLRILSANYLPCVLILHEQSGPRSVSDFSRLYGSNPTCCRLLDLLVSAHVCVHRSSSPMKATVRHYKNE